MVVKVTRGARCRTWDEASSILGLSKAQVQSLLGHFESQNLFRKNFDFFLS